MNCRKRGDLSGSSAMRYHYDPTFYPLSCLSSKAPRDITLQHLVHGFDVKCATP